MTDAIPIAVFLNDIADAKPLALPLVRRTRGEIHSTRSMRGILIRTQRWTSAL